MKYDMIFHVYKYDMIISDFNFNKCYVIRFDIEYCVNSSHTRYDLCVLHYRIRCLSTRFTILFDLV